MKRKKKEEEIWNDIEFGKFYNCLPNIKYKLLFALLYFTGMRKGECLALTWNDIKDHYLSINSSISRKASENSYEIKDPKNTSSIRDVYITNSLFEKLFEYKQEESKIPCFSLDWFIFGRTKPIAENSLTRVKDKAINEAGVKRITIHALRHSHASYLIGSHLDLKAVSQRLGHSSVQTTLNTYTHVLDKNNKEIIDFLEHSSQIVLTDQ